MFEYDNLKFRNMLITAIKDYKSFSSFCDACNLSRPNLSKYLSLDNNIVPSKRTLEKIAENSRLDLQELYNVCGYSTGIIKNEQISFSDWCNLNADSVISFIKNEFPASRPLDTKYMEQHFNMLYAKNEDAIIRYSIKDTGKCIIIPLNFEWVSAFYNKGMSMDACIVGHYSREDEIYITNGYTDTVHLLAFYDEDIMETMSKYKKDHEDIKYKSFIYSTYEINNNV